MTARSIFLAVALALAGCATGPQELDSEHGSNPSRADVTRLDTTYGQSLPPRLGPGAQMPGTTGAPAIPNRDRPVSETTADTAARPPEPSVQIPSEPGPIGTAGYTRGMSTADRELAQSVTNAFVSRGIPPQTLSNVSVRTMNGRVILSGHVSSPEEKEQLETESINVPGVKTVISQLRVVSAADRALPGIGRPGPVSESSGSQTRTGTPGLE